MFLSRNVIWITTGGMARASINKPIPSSGYETVERGPRVMGRLLAQKRRAD
jgi:hypothetical protein